MTPEQKAQIDGMDRYGMAKLWRFADSGHPLLSGDAGSYFKKRFFDDLGGFSPEISKSLGW
jgi:hypothetical protein